MSEIIRTAEMIAGEINSIKDSARATMQTIATGAAVEIGKRLREAKSLVPYGNWGEWLKDNVQYSERTAQNLMKLAEESEKGSFTPLLELSYTQAVQLIGLPAGDRAALMEETDVSDLSTRELRDLIEKYKAENAEQQTTIEGLRDDMTRMHDENGTVDQVSDAMREADEQKKRADRAEQVTNTLTKTNKRLMDELDTLRRQKAVQTKIQEPQAPAEPKEIVKEVVPAAVQKELDELRERDRRAKAADQEAAETMKREGAEYTFRALYSQFQDDFRKLTGALEEMTPEPREKYTAALKKALAIMTEEAK